MRTKLVAQLQGSETHRQSWKEPPICHALHLPSSLQSSVYVHNILLFFSPCSLFFWGEIPATLLQAEGHLILLFLRQYRHTRTAARHFMYCQHYLSSLSVFTEVIL